MKKDAKEIKKGTHDYTAAEDWIKPQQSEVLEQLEWFRDCKLALMMHFGLYSQLGIIESWPLVDKEGEWSQVQIDWIEDIKKFRNQYFNLNKSFNPVRLQADKWAKFAKENGFKYIVFTTKHHDGFCMWDTKQTDFKVTGSDCPYSANENADIVKNVFDSFRNEGLGITAYFSKPDWHCENYWEPEFTEQTDRYPTYKPNEKPEKWSKYVEFTHNQLRELISEYGPVDTLWFDGGWIDKRLGYDIELDKIIPELRKINPGLIVVDRTCGGEFENYITPECTIPQEPIDVPWEACLSVSDSFSYRFGDETYKSAKQLIYTFAEIVAKGGNMALNIAPQPDGRLPDKALKEVSKFGKWLNRCGESIYGTRICAPYKSGDIVFTQNSEAVFAIYLNENISENLIIPYEGNISSVIILNTNEIAEFVTVDGGIRLNWNNEGYQDYALSIKLVKEK